MKIGEPETLRLSYISVSNTFEIYTTSDFKQFIT